MKEEPTEINGKKPTLEFRKNDIYQKTIKSQLNLGKKGSE